MKLILTIIIHVLSSILCAVVLILIILINFIEWKDIDKEGECYNYFDRIWEK